MKRKYDGVIVLDTHGTEEGVDDMISALKKEFEAEGAVVEGVSKLGKKEFAYESQHKADGYYLNVTFEAAPDAIGSLQERLKLQKDVHLQHYRRVD